MLCYLNKLAFADNPQNVIINVLISMNFCVYLTNEFEEKILYKQRLYIVFDIS